MTAQVKELRHLRQLGDFGDGQVEDILGPAVVEGDYHGSYYTEVRDKRKPCHIRPVLANGSNNGPHDESLTAPGPPPG